MIALTSYSLSPFASNSKSFSCSGRALSTRLLLVVSCSSSEIWNTLCIFHLIGSSSLYTCFPTTWRTRKGPKNLLSSFFFLFVLMYLLFSQTFSPEALLWLFSTFLSRALFYSSCAWRRFWQQTSISSFSSSAGSLAEQDLEQRCNVMKSCDQSRDGSNQIGTI